ncbi:MAG: hypothetical protein B7733_01095 [Myxococcales bacterium FL481]|nr:MAG: hypothetical protein B7733_01095 [Myxococcales bacterium FL481]
MNACGANGVTKHPDVVTADTIASAENTSPFRLLPGERFTPLVVSVPHAGLEWPERLAGRPHVNLARNADFGVDELWAQAPRLGATMVVARYSRLVVDLNRAEDDVSPRVVEGHPCPRPRARPGAAEPVLSSRQLDAKAVHRGVVWDTAVGDIRILPRPLTRAEFEHRIASYHRPYWTAIRRLLERRRDHFGYAVLVDAHSMPGSVGVDIVLGTGSGRSCDPKWQQRALDALAAPALDVSVDAPYPGGALVAEFGRPGSDIHALQVEVSRALYMDELGLRMYASAPSDPHRARASKARASQQRSRLRLEDRLAALVRVFCDAPEV